MVGRYYTEGVEMRGLGKLKARKYNMSFEKWSANWCGWVGAFWGYEVQVASGRLKLILKGRTLTIPWISALYFFTKNHHQVIVGIVGIAVS